MKKSKSSPGKFAKAEEHARWAVRRRTLLKLQALLVPQDPEGGLTGEACFDNIGVTK